MAFLWEADARIPPDLEAKLCLPLPGASEFVTAILLQPQLAVVSRKESNTHFSLEVPSMMTQFLWITSPNAFGLFQTGLDYTEYRNHSGVYHQF